MKAEGAQKEGHKDLEPLDDGGRDPCGMGHAHVVAGVLAHGPQEAEEEAVFEGGRGKLRRFAVQEGPEDEDGNAGGGEAHSGEEHLAA